MSRRIFDPAEPVAGAYGGDWLDRVVLPDLYPRKSDPFRPAALIVPGQNPPLEPQVPEAVNDPYANLTTPGQRPFTVQRGTNFQVALLAANVPQPLQNQQYFCDSFVVSVPSTAANSVFIGFGSSITTSAGIEVFPGVPSTIVPENTREQWELQRVVELLATMIARQNGQPDPGPYRAARVVFDLSDFFAVATAATTFAVMPFYVPEGQ